MDKKLGEVTVHLSLEDLAVFRALAESDGKSASELGRDLFAAHISERRAYFENLSSVFGALPHTGNLKNR